MGEKGKVTFVMPAYNVEKYLSIAVNAIIAQSVINWELIIADDCSTDRTLEIAEEFANRDPRIRVVRMPRQSGGCYLPLKEAILKATTEFISPLDADDYIEPDYLASLLEVIETGKADTVFPCMYNWDGENIEKKAISSPELNGETLIGREAVKYTFDGWRIHCNGGLIKRSVYLESFDMLNYKDAVLKSYIDEYLTRLILFNSPKVCLTDIKYYYRVHPDSVTRVKDFRAFGFLGNSFRLLNMVEKFYSLDSEEYKLVQRHNFHSIFDTWRLLRCIDLSQEERREVDSVLKICKDRIDFKALNGNVSKNYLRLLRLPEPIAKTLLAILDRIKKTKR